MSDKLPDLPNGWEWQGGEPAVTFFGTKYLQGGNLAGVHGLGGYMGEADAQGVAVYPVTRIDDDYTEYGYAAAYKSEGISSKEEALQAVPSLIYELKQSASQQ